MRDSTVCIEMSSLQVVRFLRDNLKFFENAADVEELAASVPHTEDVYFVPCFNGLYSREFTKGEMDTCFANKKNNRWARLSAR